MKKTRGKSPSERLVDAVVAGIQEVKGKDIVHLDLRGVPNTVSDHFVVCHGDSDTQVEAIANSVDKVVRERIGERPWHTEGRENAGWVLLDYVDVVVHVFHREKRTYYALEDLWADAVRNRFENVA
ncbi:MAG: ribosome silencing factor [Flavobacteriales bacterium]|nr:ribosome silencing factor [Flavobacteriales bacterium]